MTDRLIRLMRIITLVQAKPGILARELADRCGTSERTIYRDMDALSAMHIPITHLGHGKGYAFIGNFALYPLDWSPEEASAFSQLSGSFEVIKPHLPDGFLSAYEKVMAAEYKYRAEREEKVESVQRQAVLADQLVPLLNAILKGRRIRADYNDNAEEEEELIIDPYHLISLENRYHLVGYCHRRGKIRTFRTRCLSHVCLLDTGFSKEGFDLTAFIKRKWSMEEDSLRLEFKVRFSEDALREVEGGDCAVKPVKIESLGRVANFEVPLERDREFMEWVRQFKDEAEILEPVHYREAFRYQLENWLSLYQ
ncbi:WYL domain-containing protein [Paenibacillus sp. HN-1]|uniref:helix-turn-helix transcriptional regulator n=1 Tax=Paenibacillus TaxID=44249 RepID=UPI001CA98933|nr:MULTISPECIES: WYL domain-containing protein [Paenibacillus]MBY9081302.1 WYL domain-containing protein [Paenibacillus sp. CGMCC 1.18879]MBY9087575.1 WYL domain-containing protein [Paenibacillus sinensis]